MAAETLNQSDIDRLLASTAEAEKCPVFRADGSLRGFTGEVEVEPVDFRNPALLADAELRRIRAQHQGFTRALAARISAFLRAEIGLTLLRLATQPYEAFVESIKTPTHLALLRVAPLTGVAVFEIPPRLAMSFTNRILGGREQAPQQEVYLTEIEVALLEDVIGIIAEEWCHVWDAEEPLAASLIGHESNPKFAQACPKGAMVLVSCLEVAFGDCVEALQIAVPVSMIEPLIKRAILTRAREAGTQRPDAQPVWQQSYDEIQVPLTADIEIGVTTVGEVLQLQCGEVLTLPADAISAVKLRLGETLRFTGRAGQSDGHVAVEIQNKYSAQLL